MDYITLHNISGFSGNEGFMSHQWSVLGMQMSSKVIIFGGSFAIAIVAAAVMFALLHIRWRKAHTLSLLFTSASFAVASMLISFMILACGLSPSYDGRYSPYEENVQTFTSSYGIDPKDVFVDKPDCDSNRYTRCTFSKIFYGDFVGKAPNGKDYSTWLTNQDGDGMNRPVRITATTRKGIRHMTIRLEGDNHLYLYEGTGDNQKLIVPRGAES